MSHRNSQSSVNYGLYRSRSGMILGVAKGLAISANLPVWLVRLIFILFALLTHLIPTLLVYVLLAILLRPEPVVEFTTAEEREFYNTYGDARRPALERMRDRKSVV